MRRLAFLLILSTIFMTGSSFAGKTMSALSVNISDTLQLNVLDSSEFLVNLSTIPDPSVALDKTYIASNAILDMLEGDLKDNIPSKIKSAQIKVVPSSGSCQGGCLADDYYVEISGSNFGSGWDINSVTICGVEVCHIIIQSSNLVTVYPNSGTPGTGDIVITSVSMGKTTIENGFTYQVPVPKKQAKNILYSNVDASSIDISWTRGSGESCVVFMKEGNDGFSIPSDHISYTSSNNFGKGIQIDTTGWYCVYNGNGSSVSVSGLAPGKEYIAQVFEYNGQTNFETYLITPSTDNPKIQEIIASTSSANSNTFSKNSSVSLNDTGNNRDNK
jgi:hypothetical protein